MPNRTPAFVLAVLLASSASVIAQRPAPNLSKEQRQALLAAVTAARTASPLASDQLWRLHLLRASDGSHYVAFSAQAPGDLSPDQRLALYVRLEPRVPTPDTTTATAPRSAVEEWLLGQRRDPLPMQAKRVVTIPTGEMPIGGPAATGARDGSGQNSAVLALMERQRQKEREEREARERARREELEGRTAGQQDLFPFEDFDMAAHVVAVPGRPAVFRRALTAGPGSYDVVLGWAVLDDKNRPTRTGALRRSVTLPAAQSAQLQLGSVIIADAIQPQDTPYPAEQQTAHPYSIGSTSIEPAADDVLTNDERLAIAFQILNATATPTGKPDIGISLRLFRRTAGGEEPAATLAPLNYNEETLPGDFSLYQGHPLIAAFAAPLRTLARGDYRLAILATDRLSRTSTTTDARFRIVATPAALLASAPPASAPISSQLVRGNPRAGPHPRRAGATGRVSGPRTPAGTGAGAPLRRLDGDPGCPTLRARAGGPASDRGGLCAWRGPPGPRSPAETRARRGSAARRHALLPGRESRARRARRRRAPGVGRGPVRRLAGGSAGGADGRGPAPTREHRGRRHAGARRPRGGRRRSRI